MNSTRSIVLLVVTCTLVAMCNARSIRTDDTEHRISKRSSVADVALTHKNRKNRHILERLLLLKSVLKDVDTSSLGAPKLATTSTGTYEQKNGKWGITTSGSGRRDRKRGRKHRRNRKNRKGLSRRNRSLSDSVATLISSEYGEEIIDAIFNIVKQDGDMNSEAQNAAKIVKSTARKCKCSE